MDDDAELVGDILFLGAAPLLASLVGSLCVAGSATGFRSDPNFTMLHANEQGVKVRLWTPYRRGSSSQIILQRIYSKASLVVVVVDMSVDRITWAQFIEKKMNHLSAVAPSKPFVFMGMNSTEPDSLEDIEFEVRRCAENKSCGECKCVKQVSCETGEGVPMLRTFLINDVLAAHGRSVPVLRSGALLLPAQNSSVPRKAEVDAEGTASVGGRRCVSM